MVVPLHAWQEAVNPAAELWNVGVPARMPINHNAN